MSVKVLAKRGTAAQIEGAASSVQTAGEIAFATDTKDFYVSDGTQFNKITDLESNGNFYVSGNVGIGTTSLGTAKVVIDHTNTKMLELKRNGATKARFIADSNNGQLDLYDSSTVNSVRLLSSGNSYFNGGNIGIGTTSPSSALQVVGDGQGDGILVSTVDGYNVGRIYNNNSNAFPVGSLTLSYGNTTPAFINAESNGVTIRGGATDTAGNNIKFRLYTSEQMRLTPTGLGIGTTSPAHKLDVSGDVHLNNLQLSDFTGDIYFGVNSANNKFSYNQWLASASGGMVIKNTANASTGHIAFETSTGEALRIIRGGNVGIGTTAPQQLLDITAATTAPVLRLSRNQNIGSTSWAGESLGDIEFYTNDPSSPNVFGKISVIGGPNSGSPNVGYPDGHMVFYTRGQQGGNTLSERLRITDEGNVGIGTTTPTTKLHVVGETNLNGNLKFIGNRSIGTTASTDNLSIVPERDLNLGTQATDNVWIGRASNWAGKVVIQANAANTMVVTDNKVGIGTTSPSWKLDLNGGTENVLASFSSTDQTAQLRIVDGSNIPFFFGVIGTGAYITPTGATPADGISIKDTGNVGIGIASPTSRLEVLTSTNEEGITLKDTSANLKYKVRQFNGNTYSSFWNASNSETVRIASAGNTYFNGGNIGIGTTSPQAKLDVEGVIYSRDKFVLIGSSGSLTRYAVIQQNGTEGVFRLYNGSNWGFIARGVGNDPYIGAYREGKLRIRGFGQNDGSDDATDKDLAIFDFANERVGIGTTSPNEKLQVNGNAIVQNYVYIGDGVQHWGDGGTGMNFPSNDNIDFLTSSSSRVRIDSTGNVGIGTTSAGRKLTVAGTDNLLFLDSSGNSYLTIDRSATNRRSALVFSTAGDGTSNIPNNINWALGAADSDEVGDGTGFFIGTNTAATSAKLFINSTGNVGIGTTSPNHLLDVEAAGASARIYNLTSDGVTDFYLSTVGTTGLSRLLFGDTANSAIGKIIYRNSSDSMAFETNATEAMRITNAGNVGIGTTSPTTSLDISGTITVRNSSSLLKKYEGTWTTNPTTDVLYNSWTSGTSDYVVLRSQGNQTSQGAFVASRNGAFFGQHGSTGAITDSSTAPLSTTWARIADTSFFNGSVGIGTTTPKTTLEVSGDITIQNNNGSNPTDAGSLYFAEAGLTWGTDFYGFRINQQGSSNYLNFQSANLTTVQDVLTLTRDTARVGIGTTSPAGTLHVVGTSGGAGEIYVSDVDNGVGSSDGLLISKSGTNAFIYNRDNGQISFGTNNVSNNLVITNTGNVGIGTTSPSWKLDVNGGTENILASFSSTDQTAQLRIVDSSNTPFYFGVIGTGAYISPTGGTPADGISIRNTGDIGIGQGFPTHKLDVKGDISADEFLQAPSGIPRANLGDPTVTEMALFESQMSCKTDLSDDYTDLTKVTFWQQPNEGDAWSQVTVSDDNKKKFLRTNNSSIVIPNGTYRYRVEFEPKSYRSAQAFYCYHSYRGNAFAVHVWKRRCSDNQWFQHTDSDVEVGKWPGHLYLPMDAIFWHPTDTTSTYRYNLIRIEFIPNWSASNTYNIDLFGGQLWGGYPAGRRTPHTYNHDGQLTLPANLIVPDDLIVNSGNVGIGTTSPSGALHVNQGTGDAVTSLYTSTYGTVTIARNHSTNPYIQTSFVSGQSALSFYQNSNLYTKISVGDSYFNGGNVGIGTTSPSEKLHVAGNAIVQNYIYAGDGVQHWGDGGTGMNFPSNDNIDFLTTSSSRVRITSTGSVGIGTTSPGRKLTVAGTDNLLFLDSSGNSYVTIDRSATDRRSALVFSTAGDGTSNIPNNINWALGTADSDEVGDGTGFFIGTNTAATSAKLFINSSGNVGIGTTSPNHLLDVEAAGASARIYNLTSDGVTDFYLSTVGTTGLSRLLFGDTANSAIGKIIYRNSSDSMAFETNATEAMRITSDGNVGIGTTAPTAELHVETSNQSDVLLKSTSSSSVFTADGFVNSVFAMKENGTLKSEFFYDSINNQMKIRTSSAESLSLGVNNGQNIFIRGSDGNVGIGTTSPSVPLEVKKGDTSQIISDRAGNGTNIVLKRSGVTRGVLATNDVSGKEFELYSSSDLILNASAGNNVGIGITSPSEKLEVSGNIKASGTIKGKMEQMFACSFSDDLGTDKHYLSFTSNAEQTNVHADQAAMVMPYNGRVKSIQMRLSNIDADTIRTFGIETIAPGINMYASSNNWTIEETESYELAATDDFYLVNYVFSNTSHFESGDLLAISIQDAEDAYTASRQTYITVIIEYDLNNGMGNDTATTKYTS